MTDITADYTRPKITPDANIYTGEEDPEEQTTPEPTQTQTDHPIIKFVDFAVNAAVPLCENAHLAPPNLPLYNSYSRAAVNKAAWEYLPAMEGEETPRWMILLFAVGSIGAVFAPTAISLIEKSKSKEELEPEQEPELQNHTYTPDQTPASPETTPKIHYFTDPGYEQKQTITVPEV